MSSANPTLAIFLTITVGFAALAACFFPKSGEPAGASASAANRISRVRRALGRLALGKWASDYDRDQIPQPEPRLEYQGRLFCRSTQPLRRRRASL